MIVCVMSQQTVQRPPVIAAGCVTQGVMVAVCDTQGTSQWNKAPPLYRTETDTPPPSGPKEEFGPLLLRLILSKVIRI